jgi:hypothetical protein
MCSNIFNASLSIGKTEADQKAQWFPSPAEASSAGGGVGSFATHTKRSLQRDVGCVIPGSQ